MLWNQQKKNTYAFDKTQQSLLLYIYQYLYILYFNKKTMMNILKYRLQKLKNYLHHNIPSIYKKTQQIQFKLLTPSGSKIAKVGNTLQLPKNKYVHLQRYLQRFYNSTSQNGRVNGQNLAFVTGAQNSGKSSLLKQSIKILKNRKISTSHIKNQNKQQQQQLQYTTLSSPQYLQDHQRQTRLDNQHSIIIQFDFANNFMMKTQAFLHHIHKQIIQQIIKVNQQIYNKTNTTVIDQYIIRDIVLAQNSSEYVFVYLKDTIYAILNNLDRIRLSQESLEVLEGINQRILEVDCYQFFKNNNSNKSARSNSNNINNSNNDQQYLTLYEQLINLISKDKKINNNQAALSLFLSVFKRIQYQNRPASHTNYSYQTGIQSTQYLFSILNYLCGFGNVNKQILADHINNSNNINKINNINNTNTNTNINNKPNLNTNTNNNTKTTNINNNNNNITTNINNNPNLNANTINNTNTNNNRYQSYYIGKGNHIDTVIIFMHLQKLACYNDPKFTQWYDNILIRLHNSSNLRTHFPIIIQLPNWYQLQNTQKCGRLSIQNPTIIQIPGYFKTNIFRYNPSLIFNKQAVQKLRHVLGRNPSTWNQAIIQLSKGTVSIQDIISYRTQFMNNNKYRNILHNKINRMYINQQSIPYIDNNTLQYHILQYLNIISKCNGNLKTLYLHHIYAIYNHPIFVQLYKNNIINRYYYQGCLTVSDMRNLYYIKQYVKINNIGLRQWISYRVWRILNNPYLYYMKQIKYNDGLEDQQWKHIGFINQKPEYMIREYYGELQDYKIMLYNNVYKEKYNL